MQNNLLPYPILFGAFLLCSSLVKAQTFTDITGPMGTTRCIFKAPSGEIFLGSSTKGVFRSVDEGQSWTGFGGNTIMSGRVNALAMDQLGQLLAATEQGGIKYWNGSSWINFNTGLPNACGITAPVRALALDSNGNLFAGTHSFSCFATGGLFRYDGSTWNSMASGLTNTDVNSLAVDPVSGQLFAGTDGGVFRFDGNNWSAVNAGLQDTLVHKLVFTPSGDLLAGTDSGISKLAAGETLWTNLNTGLKGWPVYSIAVDQDPLHLLIGTGYNLEQTGSLYGEMFESLDGGDHWLQTAAQLETSLLNDLAFVGNSVCLAAGWGIFHSKDNGQSWSASNNGFSARTFNTQGRMAIGPAPDHLLFYASDDGIFRSMDEGKSWTMASRGLNRHMVTLLKFDHFGNLFCGVMRYLGESAGGFGDGLLFKSVDHGDTWTPVNISKDWRYMEISEGPNGDLICAHGFGAQPPSATITGSSLALSTDHGDNWKDLDVSSGMAFCCAAGSSGDFFVAGESQSVYRSTDGGNSFELVVAPGQAGNVGVLEISPTGDILMGSGGQRTFFFSTDNGTTYTPFSSPVLPDYRGVSDVIFDQDGKAYCSTSGTGGSPPLFTVSPPFDANSIFVPVTGINGSLFKMNWDDCGYLYIYRAGGIYKSAQPLKAPEATCISGTESAVVMEQRLEIFPNPGSDFIQIRASISTGLRIECWDLSGKLWLETSLQTGESISMENIPKGIYLLRLFFQDGSLHQLKWVKS